MEPTQITAVSMDALARRLLEFGPRDRRRPDMPFDIDVETAGFFIHMRDDVTFAEVEQVNDTLLAHPTWTKHRYQIWDFLDAWALDGNTKDARTISRIDNMSAMKTDVVPIKIAFISKNAKTNEVITAYMDTIDPAMISARIVQSEEEARAWIAE